MLRDIFEQILKLEAEETGRPYPRPVTQNFHTEGGFGPREGHVFFEELHDYLTWPDTPGIENPRLPKFFG